MPGAILECCCCNVHVPRTQARLFYTPGGGILVRTSSTKYTNTGGVSGTGRQQRYVIEHTDALVLCPDTWVWRRGPVP